MIVWLPTLSLRSNVDASLAYECLGNFRVSLLHASIPIIVSAQLIGPIDNISRRVIRSYDKLEFPGGELED